MKKLFIILIVLSVYSCKIKKKAVDRAKETTEVKASESVKEITRSDIAISDITTTTAESITLTKDKKLELTQADENKVITITDASGESITIKGANVTISESNKSESTKDTLTSTTTKKDTSIKELNTKKEIDSSTKKAHRKTDTFNIGTSTWLWVAIIVLVLGFLVWKFKPKIF